MSNTSLDHASKAYLVYYKCNFTSKTENLIAECKAIIERMDNTRYIDPEKNKLPYLCEMLKSVTLHERFLVQFGEEVRVNDFFKNNVNFELQRDCNAGLLNSWNESINEISNLEKCFTDEKLRYLKSNTPLEWLKNKHALTLLLFILQQYLRNISRGRFEENVMKDKAKKRVKHSRHRTYRCSSYYQKNGRK
jgi:hypothetical protein